MPLATPQDLDDFRALRDGDDAALDRLIARWQRPLLAFAWRYLHDEADARDLVAETFVKLYQVRHRLRADTTQPPWVFTTLANRCRNQHRWRQRHPACSLDAELGQGSAKPRPNGPADDAPAPDEALAHKEELAALNAAIARLPHDLKTALFLHHFEHLSYREIGDVTGCQERGVETRLYRARQALRQALAPFHEQAACR